MIDLKKVVLMFKKEHGENETLHDVYIDYDRANEEYTRLCHHYPRPDFRTSVAKGRLTIHEFINNRYEKIISYRVVTKEITK